MSDSVRPHTWQPTRLPRPWDSPGKNTGVGCHFLLQCMKVKNDSEVTQSCPTLSDPMDCSLTGSSIHGIFQARVLEWGAIAFSDSFFRTCSFREGSPRPQWCPLYHSCLLFEALGLCTVEVKKVDGEDGTASCFQGALTCSCCSAHTRLLHQNSFACSSQGMIFFPPETSGPIQHSTSSGTSMLVCVWVQLGQGLGSFPLGSKPHVAWHLF